MLNIADSIRKYQIIKPYDSYSNDCTFLTLAIFTRISPGTSVLHSKIDSFYCQLLCINSRANQ